MYGNFVDIAMRSGPGAMPTDSDTRHRRRLVQVAGDVAGRGVEHQRGVGDGAGQHAVDGDAVERLGQRPGRDPAALRFDADEMGPRRRDAHAARAVGADGRGDQSGRHRRGAAAR